MRTSSCYGFVEAEVRKIVSMTDPFESMKLRLGIDRACGDREKKVQMAWKHAKRACSDRQRLKDLRGT